MNSNAPNSRTTLLVPGMRVVCRNAVLSDDGTLLHPANSIAIVGSDEGLDSTTHTVRLCFTDGLEIIASEQDVVDLNDFQEGLPNNRLTYDPRNRLILKCVIGSRAYGLDDATSDTDYRGIYLPKASEHWSLQGVPSQWEDQATQEHYWEIQRFIELALKANPNVLECLYTPQIELLSPLGGELLKIRHIFLSRLVYQTFNGYVVSQFKKSMRDVQKFGYPKPKHVMHLIRLLIVGIGILEKGELQLRVEKFREELFAIKRGEMPWQEVERWRVALHKQFDTAFLQTKLPELPDYTCANQFLLLARRSATQESAPCGSILD
ncbi:MAG: DNA polymerase beta superfamily protein [Planctomycetaceae bacterium]